MKLKTINFIEQHSHPEGIKNSASGGIFLYRYRKWLILCLVLILHIGLLWFITELIKPYDLATPPKVNAIHVRFVSLAQAPQPNPDTGRQASTLPVKQPQIPIQPKHTSPPIKSLETPKTQTQVLVAQQSKKVVAQQPKPEPVVPKKVEQPQPKTSTNSIETVTTVTEVSPAASKDVATTATHSGIGENNSSDNQRQGGEPNATANLQSRAVENAIDKSEPIQVSSVDLLSFGKFNYDDRELNHQNRFLILRLQIDEKGHPVKIQIQQSSGMDSLDQRALKAAQQARFKPHKINGRAVSIVVDFPIQLKTSRSR